MAVVWLALLCAAAGSALAGEPKAFFLKMIKVPAADYWVGKYEVTQAQYESITGENPSRFVDPRRPVDSVSWEDAKAFCEQLTAREQTAGHISGEWTYDLPTDEQWDEFAAGTDLADAVTSVDKPRTGTEPTGTAQPNPLGLHDVAGNVWEWCLDWYDNRIRKKDANKDMPYVPTDAEAAANGPEETFKVLRGGAWDTGPADGFTLASRLRYAPAMHNARTGFRCVLTMTKTNQSTLR